MPTSGSCLPLASRFSKRSGSRESIQRPGAENGAPTGAAKRTPYHEDRSAIMAEEGKQREKSRAILKRGTSQTDARVSTIVLSERGRSLAGTSLASETDAT